MQAKAEDGFTALHIAAGTNDAPLIELIVQSVESKEVVVNTENSDGWTPVHIAAHMNNFDALNLLMEYGGNLLKKNQTGLSPLEEMIRNDNSGLLSCVYDKKRHSARDMGDINSFGLLHMAAGQKSSNCLLYLLEQGGEPANQISNNHDKSSPLNFAVMSENIENAKLLLKYGANVNHQDT